VVNQVQGTRHITYGNIKVPLTIYAFFDLYLLSLTFKLYTSFPN